MINTSGQAFSQVNPIAGSTSLSSSTARTQLVPTHRVHRLTVAERDRLARFAPHAKPRLRPCLAGIALWVGAILLALAVYRLEATRPAWSVLLMFDLLAIALRGVRPQR